MQTMDPKLCDHIDEASQNCCTTAGNAVIAVRSAHEAASVEHGAANTNRYLADTEVVQKGLADMNEPAGESHAVGMDDEYQSINTDCLESTLDSLSSEGAKDILTTDCNVDELMSSVTQSLNSEYQSENAAALPTVAPLQTDSILVQTIHVECPSNRNDDCEGTDKALSDVYEVQKPELECGISEMEIEQYSLNPDGLISASGSCNSAVDKQVVHEIVTSEAGDSNMKQLLSSLEFHSYHITDKSALLSRTSPLQPEHTEVTSGECSGNERGLTFTQQGFDICEPEAENCVTDIDVDCYSIDVDHLESTIESCSSSLVEEILSDGITSLGTVSNSDELLPVVEQSQNSETISNDTPITDTASTELINNVNASVAFHENHDGYSELESFNYPVFEIVPCSDEGPDESDEFDHSELFAQKPCTIAQLTSSSADTNVESDKISSCVSPSVQSGRVRQKQSVEVIDVDALPDNDHSNTESDEAVVVPVIKQEKEQVLTCSEQESLLTSCFCPHGYSSAMTGHYHCRQCGYSHQTKSVVYSHEKIHADERRQTSGQTQHPESLSTQAESQSQPSANMLTRSSRSSLVIRSEESQEETFTQHVTCRCSKGFISVSGHGHFHCHYCYTSFRYRTDCLRHEKQTHETPQPNTVASQSCPEATTNDAGGEQSEGTPLDTSENRTDNSQCEPVSEAVTASRKTFTQHVTCRCSKGFRSVSGHGHFHCHYCYTSFRYRTDCLRHEKQTHETPQRNTVASQSCPEATTNDTGGEQAEGTPLDTSENRTDNSQCEPVSACQDVTAEIVTQPDVITEDDDNSQNATRVTVGVDGNEVVTQIPCSPGTIALPTKVPRSGRKVKCPYCNARFSRIETLKNHAFCVHNIIEAGDTVYFCNACKYQTSYGYSFNCHRASIMHLSNVGQAGDEQPAKQQTVVIGTINSEKERLNWFYNCVARHPYRPQVGNIEKPPPQVVWLGQPKHECSSLCCTGLDDTPASVDDSARPKRNSRRSAVAPQSSSHTAAIEKHRQVGLSTVKQKATARKSTTQLDTVADKKKRTSASQKKPEVPVRKRLLPRRLAKTTYTSDVTVIESDSDCEMITTSQNAIGPSISSIASINTDPISSKGIDASASIKEHSISVTSVESRKRGVEVLPMRCSHLSSNPSVISISQPTLKCTTAMSVKTPLCVTTKQQVLPARSGGLSVNSPISEHDKFTATSASTPLQSAPVIGVAKAVPAVTKPIATTIATQSVTLLDFPAETLWSELCRRGSLRSCDCGISYMDSTLYFLHRSCHSDVAPLKCAFCDRKADGIYDFHAHLLDHKK